MIKMYIQIEYNKMKDKELMLMLVDCCYKEVLKMENNKQITMSEIVKFCATIWIYISRKRKYMVGWQIHGITVH